MKRADFSPRVHPPFALTLPKRQTLPVVVVSAHSGDDYPPAFLERIGITPEQLRLSEDWAVDRLARAAPTFGAPLLAATFPRIILDANREPFELDPAMFAKPLPDYVNDRSAWVRSGHGTLHRQAADGSEIYREPLDFTEALDRIDRFYLPFHAQLERLIRSTKRRFGIYHSSRLPLDAVLDQLRAWPPAGVHRLRARRRKGGELRAPVTARAASVLTRRGWRARRNDPFSGAFITRHYGRPENGVHVLQLEINRALYMDEKRLRATTGFKRVSHAIAELVAGLGAQGLAIANGARKAAPCDASLDGPRSTG